jgi:hypothetical protein
MVGVADAAPIAAPLKRRIRAALDKTAAAKSSDAGWAAIGGRGVCLVRRCRVRLAYPTTWAVGWAKSMLRRCRSPEPRVRFCPRGRTGVGPRGQIAGHASTNLAGRAGRFAHPTVLGEAMDA